MPGFEEPIALIEAHIARTATGHDVNATCPCCGCFAAKPLHERAAHTATPEDVAKIDVQVGRKARGQC